MVAYVDLPSRVKPLICQARIIKLSPTTIQAGGSYRANPEPSNLPFGHSFPHHPYRHLTGRSLPGLISI